MVACGAKSQFSGCCATILYFHNMLNYRQFLPHPHEPPVHTHTHQLSPSMTQQQVEHTAGANEGKKRKTDNLGILIAKQISSSC